jgi:HlyD family secretion protein
VKGWLKWLGWLGLIVLVLVLLRVTVFAPKPIEVETAAVDRGLVEDAVTNSEAGTVKSRLRARVGAERAGRVASIPRREGAAVARGDELLLLDATTARAQLEVASRELAALEAGLGAARATALLARQEYERAEALLRQGAVSQGTLDQAVSRRDGAAAELEAAEAGVARARASVRLAREELDHLVVRAPFDGVVTQRYVEVGESVIPGQPVLEVMSPDSLYVSAPIDEIDIGRIREGLPARISLDPYPGRSWPGRVTRVAPYVDDLRDQNRTLEVEVEVIEAGSVAEAKPGTSADVELILDVRENVLRAPTFSVIEGKRVLVIEEGKAAVRNVTIGLRNWEWTEIREGLAEGELVITNLDKQGVVAGARVVAAGAREAP